MAFRLVGNKFVNTDDPQFQIYNAMGNGATNTNDGGDNFFTKRAKSIENAVGTTGAALYETGGNLLPAVVAGLTGGEYTSHRSKLQNEKTQNLMNEGNAKMADIYKKYGYDNEDAYYDASNREMGDLYKKYGYDNGENYWEDRYLAKTRGDNAALEALDRERSDIISRMSAQDAERANYYDNIQRELTGQAQANVDAMNKNARDYEDYAKNNYVSQKLAQDRGKFLGSAINTLSTGADVLLPGAGVAFNAVQGGVEGIADELEQNGLQNFDWGRAGQNATIGAVTGGVVGGLNKGLSNRLAKNGGNLFKGNNALTSGLNNLGSKTALGRVGSTIATGVGRGALSGAVGGATGGALSAGMNNGNVLEGAFQGAAQGLQQGAMAGGVMAGTNMALNATPGVGNVMRNLNQAGEDWKNSGSNFRERMSNTWNSGNSPTANLVKNAQSGLSQIADDVRNGSLQGYVRLPGAEDAGGDQAEIIAKRLIDKFEEADPYGFEDSMSEAAEADGYNWNTKAGRNAYIAKNIQDVAKQLRSGNIEDYVNMLDEYMGAPSLDNGVNPMNGGTVSPNTLAQLRQDLLNNFGSTPIAKDVANNNGLLREGDTFVKNGETFTVEKGHARNPEMLAGVSSDRKVITALPNGQEYDPLWEGEGSIMRSSNTQSPETEVYRTITGETPEDVNAAFNIKESNTFNKQNKAQMLGQRLQDAAKKQKYSALFDALDEKTARRATDTNAPERLAELGFEPENYGEFAKTSNYINEVVDSLAKKSGVKTNLPELPIELSPENIDVALTDNGIKKYNDYIRQIVADGDSPTQYSAAELLEKSRWLGNKAEKIAKTETGADVAKALKQAKYILRGHASEALDNAGVFGDATDDNVADGLAKLGFNEKVQDYYTNAIEGKSPTAGDLIRRSSLAEQARDMYSEMGKTKFRTSASHTSTNPLTQLYRSSGLEEPVNAILRSTVAPVAGGLTKSAGKLLSGAGDLYAKATGNGELVTPKTSASAPTVQNTNTGYNPATQVYNAIGRTEGAINAQNDRANEYISEAAQGANTLESLVAPTTNAATSVYNSVYGGSATPTSKSWVNIIGNAMQLAMNAGDATAFGQLYSMYQNALANSQKTDASQVKLSETQKRANAAMDSLERIENMTPDLGYNLSGIPLVGNIATFGGNDYEAEAKSLAQQIGYMVSGANIKEEEAYNIGKAYVPMPMDSEQTRRNKLQRAKAIIEKYQQTYAE